MTSYFSDKCLHSHNCIMVQEFECGECSLHFLADSKSGVMKCFACGKIVEAVGPMIIGKKECEHTYEKNGHEHHIS